MTRRQNAAASRENQERAISTFPPRRRRASTTKSLSNLVGNDSGELSKKKLDTASSPRDDTGDQELTQKPVALVFGPENGAISERLVQEAAKEASLKNYTDLYVIGFAIQPNARQLIENCDAVVGDPSYLHSSHAGFGDGRLVKEHAQQPDFQRLRASGDCRQKGKSRFLGFASE
jgi:hypothetical protein